MILTKIESNLIFSLWLSQFFSSIWKINEGIVEQDCVQNNFHGKLNFFKIQKFPQNIFQTFLIQMLRIEEWSAVGCICLALNSSPHPSFVGENSSIFVHKLLLLQFQVRFKNSYCLHVKRKQHIWKSFVKQGKPLH